jgi:hypothetical protein
MSGQPAGRLATIPAWVRYGVIAGVFAFVCTLGANLAFIWLQPADLCRTGPLIIPLLMLTALAVFLALAGAAGSPPVAQPAAVPLRRSRVCWWACLVVAPYWR